jgi:hypothetical protein
MDRLTPMEHPLRQVQVSTVIYWEVIWRLNSGAAACLLGIRASEAVAGVGVDLKAEEVVGVETKAGAAGVAEKVAAMMLP